MKMRLLQSQLKDFNRSSQNRRKLNAAFYTDIVFNKR